MKKLFFAVAIVALFAATSSAAPNTARESIDAAAHAEIESRFSQLINLANRHDVAAIHEMFWQSPSALLVAKSAVPSEGNWAAFWGNDAIDQKLHDIAASGPVVLAPDLPKLRIVGLTRELAKSYVPLSITVSYAGQDGTPKPFLLIIDWLKVGKDWNIASEIILPVPPTTAVKG